MANYIFRASSKDTPPTGGDMKSWLEYYKLGRDDEELYLAVPEGVPAAKAEEGDTLWVSLDDELLAFMPILRVAHDPINERMELWFDGAKVKRMPVSVHVGPRHLCGLGVVDESAAKQWVALSEGRPQGEEGPELLQARSE